MASTFNHHLVRRGHELAQQVNTFVQTRRFDGDDGNPDIHHLPVSATVTLIIGLVIFVVFALAFKIQYTYGMVVATLACVEDTESEIPSADESNSPLIDKKTGTPVTSPELGLLAPPRQPITSSWRSAIRHLKARAGPLSRFRGLGIYILWSLCRDFIVSFVSLGSWVLLPFAQVVAEVALANIMVTWVHTVISEPTNKVWWKRIPKYSTWRKVAPAVAIKATLCQITGILAMCARYDFEGLRPQPSSTGEHEMPSHHAMISLAGGLAVAISSVLLVLFIEVPATVSMVRVAASTLPEHIDTIVPFDRSFDGKVVSESEGGRGVVGVMDAWHTFTWPARMRLLRILAKVFAVITTLFISLALVWVGIFLAVSNGKF